MSQWVSTKKAASLLGVGTTSIKRWADDGVLPCQRTNGGHRRFRFADVSHFAARDGLVIDQLGSDSWSSELVDVLKKDDGAHRAEGMLWTARGSMGAWYRVAPMVGRALEQIGTEWLAGRISILLEHLMSARLARALTRVASSLVSTPTNAKRALLVSAPHDRHAMGLHLLEVCLIESGWRTVWAGTDTPIEELVAHVHSDDRVDMICASASASSNDKKSLTDWVEQVGSACAQFGVRLVFGGEGAWPDSPRFGTLLRQFDALDAYIRS